LKLHPDFVATNFDIERVQTAGGWTGGIADAPCDRECAVVAGAKVEVAVLKKVDVASGVRTDSVQCLNLVAGPAEVNGADGDLGEFVPGIDAIGENGEFAGYAVVGEGLERSKSNGGTCTYFAPEGIEKYL
jgi:hypothetical protein